MKDNMKTFESELQAIREWEDTERNKLKKKPKKNMGAVFLMAFHLKS